MAELVGVETRNAKKKERDSSQVYLLPMPLAPRRRLVVFALRLETFCNGVGLLELGSGISNTPQALFQLGVKRTLGAVSVHGDVHLRCLRHPEKDKQIARGGNPDTSAQEVAESNAPGQTVFDQRFAQGLDPITGEEPLQEVTGGAMDTGLSGEGGPESTAEVVAGEGVSEKPKMTTSQKKKGNDAGETSK
jgi:hypothetical protein